MPKRADKQPDSSASAGKRAVSTRRSRVSLDKSRTIVREAMKLFLKKGYGAVSMNEILSRVGGSKTTIYARFRDKANLFATVIDELLNEIVNYDTVGLEQLDVAAALMEIARRHLAMVLSERYIRLIRMVVAEVHQFPELGQTFYAHGPGRSYKNFAAYLQNQSAAGALIVHDASLAADLFFGGLLHR
ncbi:MAG TPA: TetR/AcrR family transcriptional regulator, partial [Candidatus Binataceae bacterium]|nr:TetR/AcrR family transcriptional regulator [Candidatus Binataceae bacterium]